MYDSDDLEEDSIVNSPLRLSESGLPFMGWRDPQNEGEMIYNEHYDSIFCGPSQWRLSGYNYGGQDVHNALGENSFERLRNIQQSQKSAAAGMKQTHIVQSGMASHGLLNPGFGGSTVVRGRGGRFVKGVKAIGQGQEPAAYEKIRLGIVRFLLVNFTRETGYTKSQFESSTLRKAIRRSKVSITPTGDALEVTVEPLAMTRPARQNEPEGANTRDYFNWFVYGRRAIVPRKQRYLRFQLGGKWIITRNVKAQKPRDITKLDEDQTNQLAEWYGEVRLAEISASIPSE